MSCLLHWYSVLEDLLSSTVVLDNHRAVLATAVGLDCSYNPEICYAAWSCLIRFCGPERASVCRKSLIPVLLQSASLLRFSEENSGILLHEEAPFVFLNCFRSFLRHGWSVSSLKQKQQLLEALEKDIIQVAACALVVACMRKCELLVRLCARELLACPPRTPLSLSRSHRHAHTACVRACTVPACVFLLHMFLPRTPAPLCLFGFLLVQFRG